MKGAVKLIDDDINCWNTNSENNHYKTFYIRTFWFTVVLLLSIISLRIIEKGNNWSSKFQQS